ncbi:trifunctional nucleotide phosphoesterase protein YfkN precursor [Andreesenia angusta]|uniref:Trifunctional nucleotide phosphoesterase protein YfkN n=1 Tax=Andreesenia angusta TaxID=39480 RepID=A0A1S1V4Q1_9FIRM|nr:5'-nucleotidase C-terminal domain-containing protein [Andreesenia angusta]OHW61360.1 trifunctional nucleotide phosphoesterase protein YfkN precursor [Andreesenia angusta]
MIKIIHTNDIHGKIEKDEKTKVDISKFSAKLEEIRKEHSTLLLDAGDTIHGQPIVSISEGKAMIDIMNEMKYDAMVPGNHDFNYGRERLLELAELAEFPIISANIYDEQGDRLLAPYTLKEIDGVKVGIFGITTPETVQKARPEDIEGLRFEDPVLESQKMVSILKDQERVDVIIALVHLGIDKSTMPEHRSDTLADSVEGIDLVVDGHSHTELKASRLIGEIPIVQAGDSMRCIGMVNFIKKACGEAEISSEFIYREDINGIKEDLSISRILIRVDEENNRSTSEIVGISKRDLNGDRFSVRTRETNLGVLLAEAMKYITGADIAITNGGGIRGSINAGFITRKEIVSAFPFDNYVITKEVSGKDIVKALEHGLSFYPEPSSAFPHVGGISFKLDRLKAQGKRVYDVFIAGERLEERKLYKLATNDFLASGGDSYDMFKTAKMTGSYASIDEVLSTYIKKQAYTGARN